MARPKLRSDLYRTIFRQFREHGVEIPYAQRDLQLRSVAPEVLETLLRGVSAARAPALARRG